MSPSRDTGVISAKNHLYTDYNTRDVWILEFWVRVPPRILI